MKIPAGPASEKGMREHDAGQERSQAVFLVKSLVSLCGLGAERSYFFVMPPYNENAGAKVWGLLRWDWTVKPAYCALATLLKQTNGRCYAGQVALGEGVSAFLFMSSRGAAHEPATEDENLVVWARKPAKLQLKEARNQSRLIDIVGSERSLVSLGGQSEVDVGPEPIYLAHLSGLVPVMEPMPNRVPEAKAVSPVVLSLQLASRGNIHSRVAVDIPDASRWMLEVWNLSDEAEEVKLSDLSSGISIDGLPRKLRVAPMKCRRIPLEAIRAAPAPAATKLSIGGATSSGEITPIIVPVFPSPTALGIMAASALKTNEPAKWQIRASGRNQNHLGNGSGRPLFFCIFLPVHFGSLALSRICTRAARPCQFGRYRL